METLMWIIVGVATMAVVALVVAVLTTPGRTKRPGTDAREHEHTAVTDMSA